MLARSRLIIGRHVKSLRFLSIHDKSKHAFYDENIDRYASKPITPITLKELLKWAEKPVSPMKILKSAQYVSRELPVRLARRVHDIQHLPFIVGTNPHIRKVYMLYLDSFEKLRSFPDISDASVEKGIIDYDFTLLLSELVESHSDVIPSLAQGMVECSKYMEQSEATAFLDRMIRARIGIRVIAEHHLALHDNVDNYSGIINHTLSPKQMLESRIPYIQELCELNFGSHPDVIINGHTDTTFPYIDVHLEYMIFELLKNAFRATVEHSSKLMLMEVPPVEITIGRGEDEVSIRIRDLGGGISESKLSDVWRYSFSTVDNEDTGDEPPQVQHGVLSKATQIGVATGTGGPIAGLGYGLPMTRIYAKWAGGSLDLVTLPEHGCDVFLRLPHIGHVKSLKI